MRTTIEEKRTLAVFGCGNYQNTIKRLCMVAAPISNNLLQMYIYYTINYLFFKEYIGKYAQDIL